MEYLIASPGRDHQPAIQRMNHHSAVERPAPATQAEPQPEPAATQPQSKYSALTFAQPPSVQRMGSDAANRGSSRSSTGPRFDQHSTQPRVLESTTQSTAPIQPDDRGACGPVTQREPVHIFRRSVKLQQPYGNGAQDTKPAVLTGDARGTPLRPRHRQNCLDISRIYSLRRRL